MQTRNAICQRIGHRNSGRTHPSGLPICSTCGKPYDDDDGQPSMILNTFSDPDGPATMQRRPATPPTRRGELPPDIRHAVEYHMACIQTFLGFPIEFEIRRVG